MVNELMTRENDKDSTRDIMPKCALIFCPRLKGLDTIAETKGNVAVRVAMRRHYLFKGNSIRTRSEIRKNTCLLWAIIFSHA